ncbi:ribonuclease H-like domain-containing protein [Gloeopeniophorella convolvens]|nr:ribonuclease H-like domain-containing protein [Gloeopeniophorella convolvens]
MARDDCREQVEGYPCAVYKKLTTLEDAEAWLGGEVNRLDPSTTQRNAPYSKKPKFKPANAISLDLQTVPSVSQSVKALAASSSSSGVERVSVSERGSASQPVRSSSSSTQSTSVALKQGNPSPLAGTPGLVVYTDGACSGNGRSGSIAGVGVWWGNNDTRNLCERCPGAQTNNRAELIAIIRALETTPTTQLPLVIKSDSQYSIKCVTEWLPKWRRTNFVSSKGTAVKNVELVMYLDALLHAREQSGQSVRLEYVRGHAGELGNEGADALAVGGTSLPEVQEPDWDALRARLGKKPVQKAAVVANDVDASVSSL